MDVGQGMKSEQLLTEGGLYLDIQSPSAQCLAFVLAHYKYMFAVIGGKLDI